MKVVCTHCGLPFSVARADPAKPTFCCSGCAFAFRLAAPDSQGGAPAPLVLRALAVVFLFVNQGLGALLAGLSPGGGAFAFASLGAGALAWAGLLFLQRANEVWRASDRVAAATALASLAWSATGPRPGLAFLGNALFLAWALRGLTRKKVPSKK